MSEDMVRAAWVTGRFEGIQAQSVIEHANAGINYIVTEQSGSGKSSSCVASFRKVITEALPPNLVEVTDPRIIERLETKMNQRNGSVTRKKQSSPEYLRDDFFKPKPRKDLA